MLNNIYLNFKSLLYCNKYEKLLKNTRLKMRYRPPYQTRHTYVSMMLSQSEHYAIHL